MAMTSVDIATVLHERLFDDVCVLLLLLLLNYGQLYIKYNN